MTRLFRFSSGVVFAVMLSHYSLMAQAQPPQDAGQVQSPSPSSAVPLPIPAVGQVVPVIPALQPPSSPELNKAYLEARQKEYHYVAALMDVNLAAFQAQRLAGDVVLF